MIIKFLYILLFNFLILFQAIAQDGQPHARFLKDSVKIGEPVKYVIGFRHDPNLEIIFPDSTYNFAPFEFVSKSFFPTSTDENGSYDSVIYELSTFELDRIQYLSVPIEGMNQGEKVDYRPGLDSVVLVEVITVLPDSIEEVVKPNTTMAIIDKEFDHFQFWMGVGAGLAIIVVIFLAFGKQFKKSFLLGKLRNQHNRFISTFEKYLKSAKEKTELEKALVTWKNYSGKLVKLPLASFTSKEIFASLENEDLFKALKNLDRAIYAGKTENETEHNLVVLRDFAIKIYNKKVEEIKNG
ncbi:hypothetical protein [Flexithrix dorotheae]|uniref:hypothetical protein n=1 Tax=Flexithrix dorotheae TaxID=70993 RepID=UPI0003729464|nr:hypothetical protein [Flexithrix dorotheae]